VHTKATALESSRDAKTPPLNDKPIPTVRSFPPPAAVVVQLTHMAIAPAYVIHFSFLGPLMATRYSMISCCSEAVIAAP
jgi:hypothetical protein